MTSGEVLAELRRRCSPRVEPYFPYSWQVQPSYQPGTFNAKIKAMAGEPGAAIEISMVVSITDDFNDHDADKCLRVYEIVRDRAWDALGLP